MLALLLQGSAKAFEISTRTVVLMVIVLSSLLAALVIVRRYRERYE